MLWEKEKKREENECALEAPAVSADGEEEEKDC